LKPCETALTWPSFLIVPGTTRRSASFTGSGRSSTADSSDHVVAAAPMAHARVTIDTNEAPGRFVSLRIASRSSSIAATSPSRGSNQP
jgi:hypothetical protein